MNTLRQESIRCQGRGCKDVATVRLVVEPSILVPGGVMGLYCQMHADRYEAEFKACKQDVKRSPDQALGESLRDLDVPTGSSNG